MNKKKTIVTALLFVFAFSGAYAQNKNVRKAQRSLRAGELTTARDLIRPALTNEDTKDEAETWYVAGQIYYELSKKDSLNATGEHYRDSSLYAYQQTLRIDDRYNQMLLMSYMPFIKLYKDYWAYGVYGFNNDKYKAAFHAFKKVKEDIDFTQKMDISVLPDNIDTMIYLNLGNAAYRGGMEDSAIRYYQMVVDMGYDKEAFVYKILMQEYRDSSEAKFFAVLEKGKKLFPDDEDFTQMEINYYRLHGQTDKLVAKLEEDVENNPGDYTKTFNLARSYDHLATQDRDSTATGPDTRDEMFQKAVKYYKKAIELKPNGYGANFNLGLLFYNAAARTGEEMVNLSNEERDTPVYDSLIKKESMYLDKSLPYLEKAFEVLDAKPTLTQDELRTYKNTIQGLEGVYARQDKMDKYDALEKKLKNADSKLEQ